MSLLEKNRKEIGGYLMTTRQTVLTIIAVAAAVAADVIAQVAIAKKINPALAHVRGERDLARQQLAELRAQVQPGNPST